MKTVKIPAGFEVFKPEEIDKVKGGTKIKPTKQAQKSAAKKPPTPPPPPMPF
ncbi:MAG: hypothetical protein II075_00200 [Bacteroidales bacterium]|jgi:hypothetical protein|nr:hypothetical protein [Bacteroidales bacterium]MBQ2098307.1 hypothetical protein [Bacteroidales bacterium]